MIVHINLSKMTNKIFPTCFQGNYRDSLGEFSNTSYGVFAADGVKLKNKLRLKAGFHGIIIGITFSCVSFNGQTFAEWGVDYLKLDGCYAKPSVMDKGYPKFTKALNATGRPIVFSCSWPAYQVFAKMEVGKT